MRRRNSNEKILEAMCEVFVIVMTIIGLFCSTIFELKIIHANYELFLYHDNIVFAQEQIMDKQALRERIEENNEIFDKMYQQNKTFHLVVDQPTIVRDLTNLGCIIAFISELYIVTLFIQNIIHNIVPIKQRKRRRR